MRTLGNANVSEAEANTPDLEVHGNGDLWQCICKASSKMEGWMKSTKVMEITGVGCLVQITTETRDWVGPDNDRSVIAEAITFVPDVKIAPCGTKLIALGSGEKY